MLRSWGHSRDSVSPVLEFLRLQLAVHRRLTLEHLLAEAAAGEGREGARVPWLQLLSAPRNLRNSWRA
jgi:hypothetical protein